MFTIVRQLTPFWMQWIYVTRTSSHPKICFNIVVSSAPRSSMSSFPLRIPNQSWYSFRVSALCDNSLLIILVCIILLLFDEDWRFLSSSMYFPASCCFLLSRFRYSSQYHILEYSSSTKCPMSIFWDITLCSLVTFNGVIF